MREAKLPAHYVGCKQVPYLQAGGADGTPFILVKDLNKACVDQGAWGTEPALQAQGTFYWRRTSWASCTDTAATVDKSSSVPV